MKLQTLLTIRPACRQTGEVEDVRQAMRKALTILVFLLYYNYRAKITLKSSSTSMPTPAHLFQFHLENCIHPIGG